MGSAIPASGASKQTLVRSHPQNNVLQRVSITGHQLARQIGRDLIALDDMVVL